MTGHSITTLKKRSEFVRIAKRGKKWVSANLIVQAMQRPFSCCDSHLDHESGSLEENAGSDSRTVIRVGFTASKKVGNAIFRNRAKRRMRAIVRDLAPKLADPNLDYVLIARHTTPEVDYQSLESELKIALGKLPGLLAKGRK